MTEQEIAELKDKIVAHALKNYAIWVDDWGAYYCLFCGQPDYNNLFGDLETMPHKEDCLYIQAKKAGLVNEQASN